MSALFCRHNRFTADCPICSRGTVLDSSSPGAATRAKPSSARGGATAGRSRRASAEPARFTGPHVEAGPYRGTDGESYRVRIERVPGGLRMGEWSSGGLRRRSPALPPRDLATLVREACERAIVSGPDLGRLLAALDAEGAERAPHSAVGLPVPAGTESSAPHGTSPGRSGDLRDELRVDPLDDGLVRVGRRIHRPGTGWEDLDAPVLLPAARFAEALSGAVRAGAIPGDPGVGDPPPD